MDGRGEALASDEVGRDEAPGIVIRASFEPPPRPVVSAFIWGGKVRPVPALPYGRRSA
jgi:hypothetical protein